MKQFSIELTRSPIGTVQWFLILLASASQFLGGQTPAMPASKSVNAHFSAAQQMSGGSQAEASTLKHALTVHPQNIDLLYLLGQAYEHLGKTEVAGLAKIAPGSSWSEQLLGESYLTGGDWTFAVIRFQNALA